MSDLDDKISKIVEQHVAQLGEHVASVQLIVTYEEGGNSKKISSGSGCWYSRMGAMTEFMEYHREKLKCYAREEGEDDE